MGSAVLLLEPLIIPKRKRDRNIHLYQSKLNVFILYQRLIALSNFRSLNTIGFQKITKKFDKNLKCSTQSYIMSEIVNENEFVTSNGCSECMQKIVSLYANVFENGDFNKAKVRLLDSITWNKVQIIHCYICMHTHYTCINSGIKRVHSSWD